MRVRPIRRPLIAAVLAVLLGAPGLASGAAPRDPRALAPRVGSLTTAHIVNPLGIDSGRPALGWTISSPTRGTAQAAYEVRVGIARGDLTRGRRLVWDSMRVRSFRSFDVRYGGRALRPRTRYYWQVRVWDNHGRISSWSRPAWFETAFLHAGEFRGRWIGEFPDAQQESATKGELLFRKQFASAACRRPARPLSARCAGLRITRARLYVAGLSYPYIYIDGRAVSNHRLDTAFTAFDKTVDYTSYDITRLVRPGANAVAVSLGHGFYSGGADDYPSRGEPWQPAEPKLKLELDVWHANGTVKRVVSDSTWRVSNGPTTADSPAAETYDARLAKPGWNQVGYAAAGWSRASTVSAPAGTLRAQLIPPILRTAVLKPVRVTRPLPNGRVYDFRITTSGWARITMRGRAGATVYIEYSEKLNPDGTAEREGNGSTGQTDVYTLKGGGSETYEPKYGWKGYRYIEVTTANPSSGSSWGAPLPRIVSVTGVVAHTALPDAGGFHSSSRLLNRFHVAMRDTILNNQYSYGSDTPTYEKGGWTNDNGDYATSEMANFNAEAYYAHMMQNFDDAQDASGNVGLLAPPGSDAVDPLWGGSFLLIEYDMFESYDDLDVIRRDYRHMAAYIDYMARPIAPTGYLYPGPTIGDWLTPPNATPPSSELLGSMFVYREAKDLAIMAGAIGKPAGQRRYDRLASRIRHAVNDEFYDPAAHRYRDPAGTPTQPHGYEQTANVIGLAFGLAPAKDREAIAAGLAADVRAQGDHLATGANGSKYILPMLSETGHAGLADKVATNPTAPGWGQWFLRCGATTMWEGWESSTCASDRSHDHPFMGTVDDWLFEDIAGIQPTSPGFTTVQIKPYPVRDLRFASGYETSPLGRVGASWRRSGRSFRLVVQIPVGSRASVFVPAARAASVTEGGRPVARATGVRVLGRQGTYLRLQVGSGTYTFDSTT